MGWIILGVAFILAGDAALLWLVMTSCDEDWSTVDSPS